MANVSTKITGVTERPTTTWDILDAAATLLADHGHEWFVAPRLRGQAHTAISAIYVAGTGTRHGRVAPVTAEHEAALQLTLAAVKACDDHIGSLNVWEFESAESGAEVVELLEFVRDMEREADEETLAALLPELAAAS